MLKNYENTDSVLEYYIVFHSADGEYQYDRVYATLEEAQQAVEHEERLDFFEPCGKYPIYTRAKRSPECSWRRVDY